MGKAANALTKLLAYQHKLPEEDRKDYVEAVRQAQIYNMARFRRDQKLGTFGKDLGEKYVKGCLASITKEMFGGVITEAVLALEITIEVDDHNEDADVLQEQSPEVIAYLNYLSAISKSVEMYDVSFI